MGGDGASGRRAGLRSVALVGTGVVLLVVAAVGTSRGGDGASGPLELPGGARAREDVVLLVAGALGGLVVLTLLAAIRALRPNRLRASTRLARRRAPWWFSLVAGTVGLLVVGAAVALRDEDAQRDPLVPVEPLERPDAEEAAREATETSRGRATVLLLAGAAVGVGAAVVWWRRSDVAVRFDGDAGVDDGDDVDLGLDDPSLGLDAVDLATLPPRQAVRGAYRRARLVLADLGAPPVRTETPAEYARRIALERPALHPPLQALTTWFEQAGFSTRPVTPAMRDGALAALAAIEQVATERMAAIEKGAP